MSPLTKEDTEYEGRLAWRHRKSKLFALVCRLSTMIALFILAVLLVGIFWQGFEHISWKFLTNYPSSRPAKAGLLPAIWGSLWLVFFTGLFSVPLGIGAAIYLEEYARDNLINRIIKVNLANLAGVPSIVYGILGLTVFVRFFGKSLRVPGIESALLPLNRTILSGALTLTLLILPVVIIAAQEALRAIPGSIRNASMALGATKWQTIKSQVLPAALPGVATGIILALSRALGETAPIVVVGALLFTREAPGDIETPLDLVKDPVAVATDVPFSEFTTLPIQIYNWVGESKSEFHELAAGGILILLVVLLVVNGLAVYIRARYQKHAKW